MEPSAKDLHIAECRIPDDDRAHLQLLQVPAVSYSIVQFRAQEDKQNKDLRLQVCFRVCQIDQGCQTKCP